MKSEPPLTVDARQHIQWSTTYMFSPLHAPFSCRLEPSGGGSAFVSRPGSLLVSARALTGLGYPAKGAGMGDHYARGPKAAGNATVSNSSVAFEGVAFCRSLWAVESLSVALSA